MKRTIALLLTALLAAGLLAGCAASKETPAGSAPDGTAAQVGVSAGSVPAEPGEGARVFTADNEIFTYERIDPEKTQLVVSRTGNIELADFCDEFEARNPDVQVLYLDITGGNSFVIPAMDWVRNGYAPDIMVTAGGLTTAGDTVAFFENLSASPILENYELDALQRTAVDANIYWLPGPSNINAMMYNKTLFAEYGWEVPNTFDDFVALCKQIREDTGGEVEPWNPNAKYSNELQTALEAFTYKAIFGGADNRAWYNAFLAGKATFAGHMEPYYETIQTLADNGILREEHFSYSATTRGKEFHDGKIAMINIPISNSDTGIYDFGYMPFPTTVGTLGYINDVYSCYVGIPKQAHTAVQQDAIDRFITFFSTPEGQQIYIGDSLKVSNVKDVPLRQSADLSALQAAIDAGHLFAMLDFRTARGRSGIDLHKAALELTTGAKTPADCIAEADAAASAGSPDTEESAPEVVAAAERDLTVLETSFYLADAYREAAGADVGLIAHNVPFRGNLMRIFQGELTASFLTVLKPRSFENGSTLVKADMTGQALLDALNAPPDYENGIADCIYAYSGLLCEVAPWNTLGEKYLSVKLADGTAIDPEAHYTVAFWAGTVGEAFFSGEVTPCEGSFEEIVAAKMRSDGTVAPADDGRIRLVWN